MVDIEVINTYAAKWTIAGWFIGLAYYNWFASAPAHVQWWAHLLLVIIGMAAVSIIIGGTIALIMALITRILTGHSEGSPHAFSWGRLYRPYWHSLRPNMR